VTGLTVSFHTGGRPEARFEYSREVALALESAGDADSCYRHTGVAQQFNCPFETDAEITFADRLAQMYGEKSFKLAQ
jgi:hypothetical protein